MSIKPDLVEWFRHDGGANFSKFWDTEVAPIIDGWQKTHGIEDVLVRATIVEDWLCVQGWLNWQTATEDCAPPPTVADLPRGFV
jgi:hypothetical protein